MSASNRPLAFLIATLGVLPLQAQTSHLAFEVASVKQNKTNNQAGFQVLPSGRLVIANVPLAMIITMAYGLPIQSNRLTGIPDWVRSDRFNIEATPGSGGIPSGVSSKARADMVREMMQTLLADRFKMVVRRETKRTACVRGGGSKERAEARRNPIWKKKTVRLARRPSGTVPLVTAASRAGYGARDAWGSRRHV